MKEDLRRMRNTSLGRCSVRRTGCLGQGVDADLAGDNRNRYRLAFALIGFRQRRPQVNPSVKGGTCVDSIWFCAPPNFDRLILLDPRNIVDSHLFTLGQKLDPITAPR